MVFTCVAEVSGVTFRFWKETTKFDKGFTSVVGLGLDQVG